MELADKMSFPSMAVTVDVNVVFFSDKKKRKKKLPINQKVTVHSDYMCL